MEDSLALSKEEAEDALQEAEERHQEEISGYEAQIREKEGLLLMMQRELDDIHVTLQDYHQT